MVHFIRGFLAEAKLNISVTGFLSMFKALAPSVQIAVTAIATLSKAALCCKSSPWHSTGGSCPHSKRRKNRGGVEAAEPDSCSGMTASVGGVERMRTGMNFYKRAEGKLWGWWQGWLSPNSWESASSYTSRIIPAGQAPTFCSDLISGLRALLSECFCLTQATSIPSQSISPQHRGR